MSTFEIPLLPATPQQLSVQINGATYGLSLWWNDQDNGGTWYLDLADASDVPLVNGIALVPGVDLLAQYAYLSFGFELLAVSDTDPDGGLGWATLGITDHLFVVL